MYVNDNITTVSRTVSASACTIEGDAAAPASLTGYNTFTSSPVYLTRSSYTQYTGTNSKEEISLGVNWISASTTIVMNVVGYYMILSGLDGILDTNVLEPMATWAISEGAKIPNEDAYMSYTYNTYVPLTQPTSSMHWLLVCYFYAKANRGGDPNIQYIYENYYY